MIFDLQNATRHLSGEKFFMSTNVVMPQLGETVFEGTVGKWLKNVGDTIAQYEPIMEVITDKVTTEVPSPAAGTILELLVPEGTTVKAGAIVARIGQAAETTASIAESPTTPTVAPITPTTFAAPTNISARNRFTPVVARMIAEYNIGDAELQTIQGTGDNGRISKKDIENFLKLRETQRVAPIAAPIAPTTSPRAETAAAQEIIPLSPIRRAIAEHMVRSKTIAPHVTTVHEADMSRMLAHFAKHKAEYERQGVKLTYTPYFIQAVVAGLHQVPIVNAQFSEQGILMQRALNIGLAVAIEDGLIVPVIKNADDKSLLGLARGVNDFAGRARDKKLLPDELTGGTFTITNYGIFGSLFGTPVISQPQSAILGIGAIQKRAVVINDAIAIRPMVYLALSFDHRLLDGAISDTFMNKVKECLENYPE